MKEKKLNKQDYFDLEHVIEDLELMHEQYQQTKEELYQLNVKHGALLGVVYLLRNYLQARAETLHNEYNQAAEHGFTCFECMNNQDEDKTTAQEHELKLLQEKFNVLFKDLI